MAGDQNIKIDTKVKELEQKLEALGLKNPSEAIFAFAWINEKNPDFDKFEQESKILLEAAKQNPEAVAELAQKSNDALRQLDTAASDDVKDQIHKTIYDLKGQVNEICVDQKMSGLVEALEDKGIQNATDVVINYAFINSADPDLEQFEVQSRALLKAAEANPEKLQELSERQTSVSKLIGKFMDDDPTNDPDINPRALANEIRRISHEVYELGGGLEAAQREIAIEKAQPPEVQKLVGQLEGLDVENAHEVAYNFARFNNGSNPDFLAQKEILLRAAQNDPEKLQELSDKVTEQRLRSDGSDDLDVKRDAAIEILEIKGALYELAIQRPTQEAEQKNNGPTTYRVDNDVNASPSVLLEEHSVMIGEQTAPERFNDLVNPDPAITHKVEDPKVEQEIVIEQPEQEVALSGVGLGSGP